MARSTEYMPAIHIAVPAELRETLISRARVDGVSVGCLCRTVLEIGLAAMELENAQEGARVKV